MPVPLPVPPPELLFIERFQEPITGWAMLGAGADWTGPAYPGEVAVEVWYDGERRLSEAIRQRPAGERRSEFHFGTQVPVEPAVQRITVRIAAGADSITLFDGSAADALRPRVVAAPPLSGPKLLSPVKTFGRAVTSGEAATVQWWAARARRYSEIAFKARQKVRDKLHVRRGGGPRTTHDAYVANTTPSSTDLAGMRARADGFRHKPTISVLVPVYNPRPVSYLAELIASVQAQAYPHWELCLADDASTDPETLAALDKLPRDPRIKLVRRPANGHICAATNSAVELATGEFVAFADNDDTLPPHALFRFAEALQDQPDADLLYSDEDKQNPVGHRYDPFFKPGWSPELFLSFNYLNHLCLLRRSLFEAVGRLREGYEGAQDYDLLLRASERTDRVVHIPEILYHWRAHDLSTASVAGQKPYVHTAARKALDDAITRRGIAATVYAPPVAERLNLPIAALDGPDDGPAVAVIVRGEAVAAGKTARAVKATTAYRNLTTYLVIDGATPAEALNRHAAGRSEEYLLFLEAGVEPTDSRWLSRLMAYARLSGAGAVGGLVRRANGDIVSAGTVLGMSDGYLPGDAFAGPPVEPASYYFQAESARTVTAPARGSLLTRRADFDRAGGFDADRFPRSLYDVDYCKRLAGLGLRSVHVGGAELRWDAAPDGRHDAPTEVLAFRAAHGRDPDPYYNPNLSGWDSFAPRPTAPHLLPAEPVKGLSVLFGTHNLSAFEGAPKVVRDVAVALHKQGDVSAAAFAPAPGQAGADYRAAGIPIHDEESPFAKRYIDGQWNPSEYAAALKQLRGVLARTKPRAVLANALGCFPLVEAASRAGIPVVFAIHESYPSHMLDQVMSRYARWRCEKAFLLADAVVFASRSCQKLYARLDQRGTFRVIHNGLVAAPLDEYQRRVSKADAASGLPGPADLGLRFVSVGTVCERKSQHVIVEAAAKVARTRRDFVVYLVGARAGVPYRSYVEHLIRVRGVEDVVIPVAETPDVWKFLRASDAFLCSSNLEAFSLSILEAEAFGLPLVSTPCGGLDEQVVWGQNALKMPFDDADALAGHMLTLFDPAVRTRMSVETKAAFAQRLTAQDTIDRYGATLAEVARRC